jgi:hypothetical protein
VKIGIQTHFFDMGVSLTSPNTTNSDMASHGSSKQERRSDLSVNGGEIHFESPVVYQQTQGNVHQFMADIF